MSSAEVSGPSRRDRQARRSVFVAFAVQGLTFAAIVTRLATFKDDLDLSDFQILGLMGSLGGASVCAALAGLAGNTWTLVLATSAYGLCVGAVDASFNMQGVGVQDCYGHSIMTGFHAMWSAAAVVGAVYTSVCIERARRGAVPVAFL